MFKYENFQPVRLTMLPVANRIPKFFLAPKPWAAFTNFPIITLAILITRCSMNFSLISLPVSSRIIPTILSMTIQVMTPIIPTPKYLLSTPVIRPISLEISKMMFVQFQCQRTKTRHRHWSIKKRVGLAHTERGPPEPLIEVQEATPSRQVAQTCPELRVGPHAKQPQKLSSLSRSCYTLSSDSRW